jgi:hypothetical protein
MSEPGSLSPPIGDSRHDHGGHSSAPEFFDLAAVRETVATAREFNKPSAVVFNAAPSGLRLALPR